MPGKCANQYEAVPSGAGEGVGMSGKGRVTISMVGPETKGYSVNLPKFWGLVKGA